jgi:hypothetical protein
MHRAEGCDDVRPFERVVDRRGHEIEQLRRHFGILDVQAEGVANAFDRERDGYASPADGDDKARPRLAERFVRGNRAEQPVGREIDLKPCGQEPHRAFDAHSLEDEGQAHSLCHGDASRLHADRAIGDDPGLLGPGLAACGDERLGAGRSRRSRGRLGGL